MPDKDDYKHEVIERATEVVADRVKALVGLPTFHELSRRRAMVCLKACLEAAMSEMDNLGYAVKIKNDKTRIYVNMKLFEDSPYDFDIQLRYSINGEMT